jgi:tripartite-type tricarboxylate transporter receptor subunit TctC
MKRFVSACCLALASFAAFAVYPEKPVTLVVPFPPGGSTDSIARLLGQKLQEKLGQNFVIDNRAGATGTVGAAFVKAAPADGYTLLVTSLGPLVIAPHLYKSVKYDTLTDFDPIMIAVQAPNVLAVPANSPEKTLADVLAHLKRDGKMRFASSGSGSSDHLSAELLWQQTGTQGTHGPYKGGGPATAALVAGQVEAAFVNINTILPQIKAGKVRALAVSSPKRSPLLPEVPTLLEQGVKGADVQSWQAVAAPKGTTPEASKRLHAALEAVLKDPAVRTQLQAQGFEIVADEPDHFRIVQLFEHTRYKQLIDARNIKAE